MSFKKAMTTKKHSRTDCVFCVRYEKKELFHANLADQVSVTVGIVDAGDVWEVLVLNVALHREAGFFAGEWEFPVAAHQHFGCVRSV